MGETPSLTALEAASVLHDVREARENVNNRAAAMSWMMWALVITSLAGTLAMLNYLTRLDMTGFQWGLFLIGNALAIAGWAALGGVFQNAVWRAFSVRRPEGQSSWKGPLVAFGVAFVLGVSNLFLQGAVRAAQGLTPDDTARTMEQIHHNLGFAFGMGIGGAIIVAVTILMGYRGYARRPGIIVGLSAILVGHLTTFLWFPDMGPAGLALAMVALPVGFLAMGRYYWKKG